MVKVKPVENKNKISVKTNIDTNVFSIKDNMSEYYARQAENWAHSEGIVNGIDYSSKYYAGKAKESENASKNYAETLQTVYQQVQDSANDVLDNIETNKTNAINEINTTKNSAVSSVNTTKTSAITEINNTKTTAVNAVNTSKNQALNDIEKESSSIINFKEEVSAELETKVDLDDMVEINLGNSFELFDTKLTDHVLTYQETKGWALQGTYVYKEALAGSRYGYPDFYAKCLEEFKQATTTETVNGVTVKVHSNGHKFYDIADKNSIDLFYNATGTAWFYGIDAVGERIFLPRDNYFAIKGIAPTVGTGSALGVTNDGSTVFPLKAVQTTSGSWDTMPNLNVVTNDGVSASSTLPALNGRSGVQDIGGNWDNSPSGYYGVSTDPQSSGLETHLQPKENKYLYICVGNTTNYEGISDVVNQGMEILDQINAGFVPKDSMEEVPCIVETYVNGTSWYRVYSDGWCEQGGIAPRGNDNEYIVVFLKEFKDTNYSILRTNTWFLDANVSWKWLNFWNKTTTQATTYNSIQSTYGGGFSWEARGYIA